MSPYTCAPSPKCVGGYRIGGKQGVLFGFPQKPNWLHRTMTRLCLGWEWVDL